MTAVERQMLYNRVMEKTKDYIDSVNDDVVRAELYKVLLIACGTIACFPTERVCDEKRD